MYIEVTIGLKNYHKKPVELRLSDKHTVKKLISITWQTMNIAEKPNEGHWIRVENKNSVYSGPLTLEECGIKTGDKIEIL